MQEDSKHKNRLVGYVLEKNSITLNTRNSPSNVHDGFVKQVMDHYQGAFQ